MFFYRHVLGLNAPIQNLPASKGITHLKLRGIDIERRLVRIHEGKGATRPPSEWKRNMSNKVKISKSSGNVFHDIGVNDAGLHQVKAELGILLIDLIGKMELTQVRAAALLGIRQPELSRLKGGNLSHYSVERLLGFLNRLDQRIEIKVRPSTKTKSAETVLS